MPPGGILTYKRKKGNSDASQSRQKVKKFKTGSPQIIMDDEYDELKRVQYCLGEVVRSIIKPKYVKGFCQDLFWQSFMNSCDDPDGPSLVLRDDFPGNKQVEEGFHSKTISMVAENKLKEILSGRYTAVRSAGYSIPLDTVAGKLEGVLYDVLTSGSFGLLCDIICENFQTTKNEQPVKMDIVVAFSSVLSKLRKGSYDQSPELFEQDVQVILRKFIRIGREMSALACGLATLTKYRCDKLVQAGTLGCSSTAELSNVNEKIVENASSLQQILQQIGRSTCSSDAEKSNGGEKNVEKIMGSFDKNREKNTDDCAAELIDVNSGAAAIVNSCAINGGEFYESTSRSEETIPCWRYTYKRCGTEADGNKSLICDGCDRMYHIACTDPIVQESPIRSWYCTQCSGRNECEDIDVSNDQHDCLHEGCVFCERLKASEYLEDMHGNTENIACVGVKCKREHSSTCEERDDIDNESPEPSRTAVLHLCKHCGTREEEDKKFLICSHRSCHFKYYHIRCLNTAQLAREHQPEGLWYCPSCLCRTCLADKDDHLICLCDRCDEAYHTYCMDPPRKAIPKGIWCCISCNKERITEGIRRFEENILSMQVVRNEVTARSKGRGSSKKALKTEHEGYCEPIEADCRGGRALNEPQIAKEVDTEQLKKHLRQTSPSSQAKTVQHRELKQNDVKQQQMNSEMHHQPDKNGLTEKPIYGTAPCEWQWASISSGWKKLRKRQRSHLNYVIGLERPKGCPDAKNSEKPCGRNDVEGQHTNGDMEEQPVKKMVGLRLRQRKPPHHTNADMGKQPVEKQARKPPRKHRHGFQGQCEGGVRVQQENGNKMHTNKTTVQDPMGVLFDALDVSEKLDEEAHKNMLQMREAS